MIKEIPPAALHLLVRIAVVSREIPEMTDVSRQSLSHKYEAVLKLAEDLLSFFLSVYNNSIPVNKMHPKTFSLILVLII